MVKIALILSVLLSTNLHSFCQNDAKKDSIANAVCKTFTSEKLSTDSLTLMNAFAKNISAFGQNTPEEIEKLIKDVYFRLQTICPGFHDALNRIEPVKGEWIQVDEEPRSYATAEECNSLFTYKKLWYIESTTGDSTFIKLTESSWTDVFSDKTFSRLSLTCQGNCEFIISFEESNNESRKGLSNVGDKYRYKVLKKEKHWFEMMAEVVHSGRKVIFKIYYETVQ